MVLVLGCKGIDCYLGVLVFICLNWVCFCRIWRVLVEEGNVDGGGCGDDDDERRK